MFGKKKKKKIKSSRKPKTPKIMALGGEQLLAEALDYAGINAVLAVPGLPGKDLTSHLLENTTLGKQKRFQWSLTSRTALDTAAGMVLGGWWVAVLLRGADLAPTLDTLQTLALSRFKGSLVLVVGDDPAAWFSHNSTDSRALSAAANLPVLELERPQDSFQLVRRAFEWSESYQLPVVLRYTSALNLEEDEFWEEDAQPVRYPRKSRARFKSPVLSLPENVLENHTNWRARLANLQENANLDHMAKKLGSGPKGILTAGYLLHKVLSVTGGKLDPYFSLLPLASSFPIPDQVVAEFLQGLDELLILEEVEPVVERQVLQLMARENWNGKLWGKTNQKVPGEGEIFEWEIEEILTRWVPEFETENFFFPQQEQQRRLFAEGFCEGCSHLESIQLFLEVVDSLPPENRPLLVADSGCVLHVRMELPDVFDVSLSSGSALGLAVGLAAAQKKKPVAAVLGDTTFYRWGVPQIAEAVTQQRELFVLVLDNSLAAKTGFQPNPGSGWTAFRKNTRKIEKDDLLFALKVDFFRILNLEDSDALKQAFLEGLQTKGVRVVVVKKPCNLLDS